MKSSSSRFPLNLNRIIVLLVSVLPIWKAALVAEDRPNIVMIVLDDLNDFVGVMGGHPQAKTPNIDRLADRGILFTNAHSNTPVCLPVRASFMRGVHPVSTGHWGFVPTQRNPIAMGSKTIPEYARENGYKVYSTGKVMHEPKYKTVWDKLGQPATHGPFPSNGKKRVNHPALPDTMLEFGELDGVYSSLADIPVVPATDSTPETRGWFNSLYWDGDVPTPFRYVNDNDRDKMIDEKSIDWMKETIAAHDSYAGDSPFLFALGILRPHTPFVVPQKYFDMFPLETLQLPPIKENDRDDIGVKGYGSRGYKIFKALENGYEDPNIGLKLYLQAYLASVAFADDIVGQALDAIDASPYRDNTVVMLFSDHGYHFGEKDEVWKFTHWDDATRVPFIISDLRDTAHAGKTVNHPISLVDVFPTIADLGAMTGSTLINSQGAPVDGHSLRPFLEDPEHGKWDGPDYAVMVTYSFTGSKEPRRQNLSIRTERFRYILYGTGGEELYDHANDPHEWTNLASNPEYASVVAKLKAELYDYVPASLPGAK
ncbi:MAG: sulfatase [Opitutales bacterium]